MKNHAIKLGWAGVWTLLAAAFSASAHAADADSRESLFGDSPKEQTSAPAEKAAGSGVKGYLQFEMARTVASPDHWSKLRTRGEITANGNLGDGIKWKLGARADYDAVYDIDHFYPSEVRKNQRADLVLRENYIDISRGNWDFRLGRQHVVWGEMVGLFFADVVSARDLREFILPDFEPMRIPQWAARAEYFKEDFHAELLWIPVASYDRIGKPGAEFYPCLPGVPCDAGFYRQERIPERNLHHGNYGLRLSTLKNGWDVSGFIYSSMDVAPAFYREWEGMLPVFQARHGRIEQVGGTLAKDFGSVVLKAEAVYTQGRKFGVLRLTEPDGVVSQNTVDWAVGLDFNPGAETRFNVQFFQRAFTRYDQDILPDRHENGYSLYLSHKFSDQLEAQALFISGMNRGDWVFRPKLTWNFEKNWRLLFGADVFQGSRLGMFGQYDPKDRVYSEVRYSF